MSGPALVRLNDFGKRGMKAVEEALRAGALPPVITDPKKLDWKSIVIPRSPLPAVAARAQVDRLADSRMNKTERRYAQHLERQLAAREIARWDFEPVTLRIGPVMFYTPDFRVIMPDGIEIYDDTKALWKPTKKHPERAGWKEDARAKIKAASELHPYLFRGAVEIKPGIWKLESFGRPLAERPG
jgi:hypothetical protein